MPTGRIPSEARAVWSWTAVIAGIVASLIVQVLLTLLALGVGLFAVDLPTANAMPTTVSTAAVLWWIASGVFAAFIGGAVTGALTPFDEPFSRLAHALGAWAIAVLIVVAFSTIAAGTSSAIGGNIAGPGANAAARYQTALAPRPGINVSPAQVEQARKAIASGMLASFIGLICGALAASIGAWWSRELAESIGTEPLTDSSLGTRSPTDAGIGRNRSL